MLFRVTHKKFYQVDVEVIHERLHVEEFGELTFNVEGKELWWSDKKSRTLMRLMRRNNKPVYLADHRLLRILKRK